MGRTVRDQVKTVTRQNLPLCVCSPTSKGCRWIFGEDRSMAFLGWSSEGTARAGGFWEVVRRALGGRQGVCGGLWGLHAGENEAWRK